MEYVRNSDFERDQRGRFYLNQLLSLHCAADMLADRLFPNAKEVTESFAGFWATQYLPVSLDDRAVSVVAVGDGHTPRTAATCAFRSAWNCYSVDPVLRPRSYSIQRLTVVPSRIEEVRLSFDGPVIILAVHAHVTVPRMLGSIKAEHRHVIAIPCCVDTGMTKEPDQRYSDLNIWSPKNEVRIWRDV